jgi:lysophospholipase L1-like esterase
MFARSHRGFAALLAAAVVIPLLTVATACATERDHEATVSPIARSQSLLPRQPLLPQPAATESNLAAPPQATGNRVVVIGDSYTGGSAAGGFGPHAWTGLLWDRLAQQGIHLDPQVSGLGGSGYVTRGPTHAVFGDAATEFVQPDDKVVVFFGGLNDGMQPPDQVAAAARAAFEHVRQTAPNARLLVIGPAWPNDAREPALLNLVSAIRGEAEAVGADFVDPVADGWFVGTPPGFIGGDNIHPTDAGHVYMADKIEPYMHDELVKAGIA